MGYVNTEFMGREESLALSHTLKHSWLVFNGGKSVLKLNKKKSIDFVRKSGNRRLKINFK